MKIRLLSVLFFMFIFFTSQLYGVTFDREPKVEKSIKTKAVNPKKFAHRELRIKKFIMKNIVNRFKIFNGNVKIVNIFANEKVFTLTGRLVSPDNKPMDLVGKFCEALENSKKFGVVIPSLIKKEDVEEQNKVYFVLMVNGSDNKIKNSEIK